MFGKRESVCVTMQFEVLPPLNQWRWFSNQIWENRWMPVGWCGALIALSHTASLYPNDFTVFFIYINKSYVTTVRWLSMVPYQNYASCSLQLSKKTFTLPSEIIGHRIHNKAWRLATAIADDALITFDTLPSGRYRAAKHPHCSRKNCFRATAILILNRDSLVLLLYSLLIYLFFSVQNLFSRKHFICLD